MGIYVNPSCKLFEQAKKSRIYVDKSGIIEYTNSVIETEEKYICISRPRRFGKTMNLNMLSAYYGYKNDVKKLFANLKVSADENKAGQYNTILINMLEFYHDADGDIGKMLKLITQYIIEDIQYEFPKCEIGKNDTLVHAMHRASNYTNRGFVILIDEWDGIFRKKQTDALGQSAYLDFLRNWLKDREYVALAYMTGILPIKKYGEHSALNMFREFSMNDPDVLEEFVGFTAEEVKALCEKYSVDYYTCKAWYDGYSFSRIKEIYNPLSVVCCMTSKKFANYWNKTETYEALSMYIKRNFDGLKDMIIRLMSGERQKINIANFSNDMVTFNSADDVLTLLIHLGYLGYDMKSSEVFIPNNEIRAEFATSVRNNESYYEVEKAIISAEELLEATWNGDNKFVAELIEKAHLETAHLQYNDENELSYTVSLAYYTAREKYNVYRELPTGKGFADLVFIPRPNFSDIPAMVIELKWNKSAKTAINQIKNKEYSERLKGYEGNVLLVGINYSKKTRKHVCIIEKA